MSDKIKPSEVSQVLLDQLKGISGRLATVLRVYTDCAMQRQTNFSNLRMALWRLS